MLITQRIERMTASHTDSRRTVGRFLLNEGARVGDYTMQQVADVTYTSKATLVRVAKQLGFAGWRDFVAAYRTECEQSARTGGDVDTNRPFAPGDSAGTIAQAMLRLRVEAMEQAHALTDEREIAHAARLLARAGRIGLFGVSNNALVLGLFQRELLTIGVPSLLSTQAEMGMSVELLGSADCALMVSYSGENETRHSMRVLPRLKERGVPVVAITGAGDSHLRRNADCTLTMASQERLFAKAGTFASEASLEYLLDVLFACCFARDFQRNWEYRVTVAENSETNRRPRDASRPAQK